MIKIFNTQLFLSLIVFTISCDDSFLDENKNVIDGYELDEIIMIPYNVYENQINIQAEQFIENAAFSVLQYPQSIHLNSFKGTIKNKTLSIPYFFDCTLSNQYGETIYVGSIIVKIDNFGCLIININAVDYGYPVIRLNLEEIDFKDYITTSNFEIKNVSDGMLPYRIIKYPSWIEINENLKEGLLSINESSYIEIRCNRFNMVPESYEGEIEVLNMVSNEIAKIKVKMIVSTYMNPKSLIAIEGNVMDAVFDKNRNTINLVTQNPNKLISYHIDMDIKKELTLDRNINCITFTDDYQFLFIGQSAKLTQIDVSTFSVVNAYDLDFNVFDIVYDGSEFCYMTYKGSGFENLPYINRLNLKTKQDTTFFVSDVYDNTNLYKVKNSNYFLATRENISPNGVILFDHSSNKPTIVKYWHDDTGKKFWFSEDQKYMFTQYGRIYSMPTIQTGDKLSSLGIFVPSSNDNFYYYDYNWMDHCVQSKSVWAAYNDFSYEVNKYIVIEFDDMNYTRKRVIPMNDYHTTINGITGYYPTVAHFVFSNTNGDKITLVKSVANNAYAWHLEVLDISN